MGALGPVHGLYGRGQLLGVLTDFAESFESVRIEPHEFIEAGDDVVVPWTAHMVGRDGIDVHARITWTWTIRNGAIERVCMYQGEQEALRDAGLRGSAAGYRSSC